MAGAMTLLLVFSTAGYAAAMDAQKLYEKRCKNCHGSPGWGGTRTAPDLADTKLTFEQFEKQIKYGSNWEGKPPKRRRYRYKKMPPQLNLSESEMKSLYSYIRE